MSANIQEVLRIYNAKPKKLRRARKQKPCPQKLAKRTQSQEPKAQLTSSHRRMHSVDPAIQKYLEEYRNYSYSHLPRDLSLDDSLERLQGLVERSGKVRSSRLSVQVQVLQLEVSALAGKLNAIEELDDLAVDDGQTGFSPADALAHKYQKHCDEKLKKVH